MFVFFLYFPVFSITYEEVKKQAKKDHEIVVIAQDGYDQVEQRGRDRYVQLRVGGGKWEEFYIPEQEEYKEIYENLKKSLFEKDQKGRYKILFAIRKYLDKELCEVCFGEINEEDSAVQEILPKEKIQEIEDIYNLIDLIKKCKINVKRIRQIHHGIKEVDRLVRHAEDYLSKVITVLSNEVNPESFFLINKEKKMLHLLDTKNLQTRNFEDDLEVMYNSYKYYNKHLEDNYRKEDKDYMVISKNADAQEFAQGSAIRMLKADQQKAYS